MSPPRLPLEVMALIIDEVAIADDEYFSDTKSCGLVCKEFLPLTRRWIFHKIELCFCHGETADAPYFQLWDALASSPEIASFTRYVNLSFITTLPDGVGGVAYGRATVLPRLPRMFDMFRNVTTFRLSFSRPGFQGRPIHRFDWAYLPSSSQKGFMIMIMSPAINDLTLDYIVGIPQILVKSFLCIKNIHFIDSAFETEVKDHSSSMPRMGMSNRPVNIKSLTIRDVCLEGVQPFVDALASSNCKLETLKLLEAKHWRNEDLEISSRIIQCQKDSLTTFELCPPYSGAENESAQNIGLLHCLRTIKAIVNMEITKAPLTHVENFLMNVPLRNEVQEIILQIELYSYPGQKWDKTYPSQWATLDMLLTDSKFMNLKRVVLITAQRYYIDRKEAEEVELALLRSFLPKAFQTHTVQYKCTGPEWMSMQDKLKLRRETQFRR